MKKTLLHRELDRTEAAVRAITPASVRKEVRRFAILEADERNKNRRKIQKTIVNGGKVRLLKPQDVETEVYLDFASKIGDISSAATLESIGLTFEQHPTSECSFYIEGVSYRIGIEGRVAITGKVLVHEPGRERRTAHCFLRYIGKTFWQYVRLDYGADGKRRPTVHFFEKIGGES